MVVVVVRERLVPSFSSDRPVRDLRFPFEFGGRESLPFRADVDAIPSAAVVIF